MKEYEKLEKAEKALYKRIAKIYERNLKQTQKEIAAYYTKYGVDKVIEYRALLETLNPVERDILYRDWERFLLAHPEAEKLTNIRYTAYKINRLEGLQQQIKLGQLKQGIIEAEEYEKHLKQAVNLGWNASLNGQSTIIISDATVKMIADTMWKPDETIASSILGKKAAEAEKIWNHVKDGFIRGDSYDRMAKVVRDRFDINYRSAKQWIYTEGTRCISEGKARGFLDMGYKEYIFRTMQDERVCEICERLDGEKFSFADRSPGDNFPPMHNNCRCSFEVVQDDDAE